MQQETLVRKFCKMQQNIEQIVHFFQFKKMLQQCQVPGTGNREKFRHTLNKTHENSHQIGHAHHLSYFLARYLTRCITVYYHIPGTNASSFLHPVQIVLLQPGHTEKSPETAFSRSVTPGKSLLSPPVWSWAKLRYEAHAADCILSQTCLNF